MARETILPDGVLLEGSRPLVFEETRTSALERMGANPESCETYEGFSNLMLRLIKISGISNSTFARIMDTLVDLNKIHFPHCPRYRETGDEDKMGANTHTNK